MLAALIMPKSKHSSSGLMPRVTIFSPSAITMSGAFWLVPVGKSRDVNVRLARSGRAAPVSSSTSLRRSNSGKLRPLQLTQMIASGKWPRMPRIIRS
jgi:hypothetical protein